MRLVVAFLLAAAPAWAQDHAACFPTGAPEGAPAPTEFQTQTVQALSLRLHALPTVYRRVCGLGGPEDRAYFLDILNAAGCSEQSPVGAVEVGYLTMEPSRLVSMFHQCDPKTDLSANEFGHFCDLAGAIAMPLPGEAGSAEWTAARERSVDAMSRLEAILFNAGKRGC